MSARVYTHAELEQLWVKAGGPASQADTAAAIAQAESGGNPGAHNASGATGLWQILGNPFPGNATDPTTNAKMAVAKFKSAGNTFTPWTTYTGADTPGHQRTYASYLTGTGYTGSSTAAPSSAGAAKTVAAAAGSTLFGTDKQGDLKYSLLWIVAVVSGLAIAAVGLNRTLGNAPSNAVRQRVQTGKQVGELALMA